MALNDLFKVLDHQRIATGLQDVLNVYWYSQTAGTGGAEELAIAWNTDVLGVIKAIQSSEVEHKLIEVINLNDPTDFYNATFGSPQVGSVVGSDVSNFMALGFKLVRATRALRHGYKRLAGVTEEIIASGGIDGQYTDEITAIEEAFEADLTHVGTSSTYSPRIVRVVRTNPGSLPAQYSYQSGAISGVDFYGLTTQNTRKR